MNVFGNTNQREVDASLRENISQFIRPKDTDFKNTEKLLECLKYLTYDTNEKLIVSILLRTIRESENNGRVDLLFDENEYIKNYKDDLADITKSLLADCNGLDTNDDFKEIEQENNFEMLDSMYLSNYPRFEDPAITNANTNMKQTDGLEPNKISIEKENTASAHKNKLSEQIIEGKAKKIEQINGLLSRNKNQSTINGDADIDSTKETNSNRNLKETGNAKEIDGTRNFLLSPPMESRSPEQLNCHTSSSPGRTPSAIPQREEKENEESRLPLSCYGSISGSQWGCQKKFATTTDLKNHWMDSNGSKCLERFIQIRKLNTKFSQ